MGGLNKLYLVPLAVVVLVIGAYYGLSRNVSSPSAGGWQVVGQSSEASGTIKIYITGGIENPGVYEMAPDCRVADAVEAAGGPTADADMDSINLSAKVKDEQHIKVPKIGDTLNGSTTEGDSRLININTADSRKLQELSGIGEVTAGKIIAYREANGGFKSIEEIKEVDRIGDKTFESIAEYITVD